MLLRFDFTKKFVSILKKLSFIKIQYQIAKKAVRHMMKVPIYHRIFIKYRGFTMIPEQIYIENLELSKKVTQIEGDIVECGVWRGGMIAGIAELMGNNRTYYLFDSFEGLPDAKDIDGKTAIEWQKDKESPHFYDNCKVDISFAEEAMKLSGVSKFKIIKGWFSEILPNIIFNNGITLLRLDADWYESTFECLEKLYPKVVAGGLIIIDDYYVWDGCAKAVHDYLSIHKLSDRICRGDFGVCYIIKGTF